MNRKVKTFKQTAFLSEQCALSKVTTTAQCSLSALTQAWSFCQSFIALSIMQYVVRIQPRNPLFGCVKSLMLLRKPRIWF